MSHSYEDETLTPLDRDDFNRWYADHRKEFLDPARESAAKALGELLDRELTEPERVRAQVRPGRVKSPARVWMKLVTKYPDACTTPEQVPEIMDDLVGLRIVCTNNSDLRRVKSILEDLPVFTPGEIPVLATEKDSVRDYFENPKPSGYRAWHVNICTTVNRATERHPVTCELQVRTLLQDGWGELTHEDTYKPGAEAPALVTLLSRRMAALMDTLDDIAQDLRDEMDRLAYDATQDRTPEAVEFTAPVVPATDKAREAGIGYLKDRLGQLDRPVDLASLAWELQRELGQGIVSDWLGSGSFKQLVRDAVPDLTISERAPSYVLPDGYDAQQLPSRIPRSDCPRAAQLLHESDRSFPMLKRESWADTYRALSWATNQIAWIGSANVKLLNELTRVARGGPLAIENGVKRRWIDYVGRTLMFADALAPAMSPEEVERAFREWTVERAIPFGLNKHEIQELEDWLSILPASPERRSGLA